MGVPPLATLNSHAKPLAFIAPGSTESGGVYQAFLVTHQPWAYKFLSYIELL